MKPSPPSRPCTNTPPPKFPPTSFIIIIITVRVCVCARVCGRNTLPNPWLLISSCSFNQNLWGPCHATECLRPRNPVVNADARPAFSQSPPRVGESDNSKNVHSKSKSGNSQYVNQQENSSTKGDKFRHRMLLSHKRKWNTYTHNIDASQKPTLGERAQTQKDVYCRIPEQARLI